MREPVADRLKRDDYSSHRHRALVLHDVFRPAFGARGIKVKHKPRQGSDRKTGTYPASSSREQLAPFVGAPARRSPATGQDAA